MGTPTSSSTTRRRALVVLAVLLAVFACLALSGCFALFSLDGYGPPDDTTLADGGAADAPVEGSRDAGGDAAQPGRIIFVTNQTFDGNLGARDGGDTKCQLIATDAGLAGNYRVWLSDELSDAADHLARDAGPLRLRSGAVVAADVEELVQKGPRVAIAVDERGRTIGGGGCNDGGLAAWTDTAPDGGNAGPADCTRWSVSAAGLNDAIVGLVGQTGSAWTDACTRTCDTRAALYCIQQ